MTNPVPKARAMTPAQVVAYLQVSERPDRGAVLGEGNDRATAEQRKHTHAVQPGMWCLSMDTEEIQAVPAQPVGAREGAILWRLRASP